MTQRSVGTLAASLLLLTVLGYCWFHAAWTEAVSHGRVRQSSLAIVAYSSDSPDATLLWGSTRAHQTTRVPMITVGRHEPLFQTNADKTPIRGWMHRFRRMADGIRTEYEQRQEDFVVLIGDAYDTYLTESTSRDTLDQVLERFEAFNASIVFSSQVYCCNPWNLHEIGRAGWDDYYARLTPNAKPATIYKHLNAGLFMGRASAIVQMAEDMNLWEKEYQRPETWDARLQTARAKNETIPMSDVSDIDDDEWQLSLWFIRDQSRPHPRAVLDLHQSLFTTTGTFRASHRDGGFLIFSPDDFYGVVGTLPVDWEPSPSERPLSSSTNRAVSSTHTLDQVTQCPYTYHAETSTWTNTITNQQPLFFHFAGNDWLCACQILATEGYRHPHKFSHMCATAFPLWHDRVNEAVAHMSQVGRNPHEQLFLASADATSEHVSVPRHLAGYNGAPVVVANCTISRFDLWNGDTDTISLVNFTNGSAFCSGTFAVSLEAVDGNHCVRNVRFDLQGPNGYHYKNREFVAPYFLFGNSGSLINGRIMRPGNYTLQVVANRGQGPTASLQFHVDNC